MDIGTGITVGCAILGAVVVVRIFKKSNNPNLYVTQNQFNFFVETVLKDFKEVKEGIRSIHKRIDKLWEEK